MWKQLKHPKCPSTDDKRDVVHTHTHAHTQWNTTQLLKRGNNLPFVVAWMDGPGRHYAKRNTV